MPRLNDFQAIVGEDAVSVFDPSRIVYPSQVQSEVRKQSVLNVLPESGIDIYWILRKCHADRIPVTPVGGLTSIRGQSAPVYGGIVIDTSKMRAIKDLDTDGLTATILPGFPYSELIPTITKRGYRLRVTPLRNSAATVGGFVGEGGLGIGSLKYGSVASDIQHIAFLNPSITLSKLYLSLAVYPETAPYVRSELDPFVRTGSGKVTPYGLGYDLKDLFVGSEGTLGVLTQVTFGVRPGKSMPTARLYEFTERNDAIDACLRISIHRNVPYFAAVFNAQTLVDRGISPLTASTYLLTALDEEDAEMRGLVEKAHEPIISAKGKRMDVALSDKVWKAVNAGLTFTDNPNNVVMIEEIKIPAALIGNAFDVVDSIASKNNVRFSTFAPMFSRTEALLCVSWMLAKDDANDMQRFESVANEIRVALSESFGVPYGIGLVNVQILEKKMASHFAIMRAVKQKLDPKGILNPGKMFPSYNQR